MVFKLPELKFEYSDLEPHFDTETMELHHDAHHRAYVTKLNETLENYPALHSRSIEELLICLDEVPEEIHDKVRNFGGGHYNHSILWNIIGPDAALKPKGKFGKEFELQLGDVKKFKEHFSELASELFGSGYVWLCMNASRELVIKCFANQDCPLSHGLKPILTVDMWEHAYYLRYQNKKEEYLDAYWKVLDWSKVGKMWEHHCQHLKAAA